ncbi:MAG TPA: Asp-tRNA(Asn)/Glu-tRNA(Gln) amidotransferase subunit GatA, partial [Bacteroidetes bacterium]|nr:Asp-tRNA(Asn)/Glu-tRNA(Gln) amidotransferase subunit GatA [Bacteroidota bacterium]
SKNAKDLESTYTLSRSEGFGEEVKRRIMLGTFVLSSGYYDAYFSKAQKARRIIKEATEKILDEHDFIVLPTTTDTAFKIGEKVDDPVKMYLSDIFTVQANLAGIPAISIPLFTHSNRMPIGVQIMSKKLSESELLNFSQMLLSYYS